MAGVQHELNYEVCRKSTNNLDTDPWDAGTSMMIGSGGFLGRDRKFRHGKRKPDPYCCHDACRENRTRDTREHIWWHCPRWEEFRPPASKMIRPDLHTLHPCFILCGLITRDCPYAKWAEDVHQLMVRISTAYTDQEPLDAVSIDGAPSEGAPLVQLSVINDGPPLVHDEDVSTELLDIPLLMTGNSLSVDTDLDPFERDIAATAVSALVTENPLPI
eukprot:GEMP01096472.1.p1 GENE.GEMP01096472.1~~GEMP01096472.1.p1  ORF type:complete len:217 (-),score=8.69 GEMP01096472.1:202-852(-)